jgi:hypothetical protein
MTVLDVEVAWTSCHIRPSLSVSESARLYLKAQQTKFDHHTEPMQQVIVFATETAGWLVMNQSCSFFDQYCTLDLFKNKDLSVLF